MRSTAVLCDVPVCVCNGGPQQSLQLGTSTEMQSAMTNHCAVVNRGETRCRKYAEFESYGFHSQTCGSVLVKDQQ